MRQAPFGTQDSLYKAVEKNRSDIQLDIRNEGLQIERAFENSLNKNFLELDRNLKDRLSKADTKINTLNEMSKKLFNYIRLSVVFSVVIFIVSAAAIVLK